jgi:hypothetical protein
MKLQQTRKHRLVTLFTALVFALMLYSNKAQAQLDEGPGIEADIPFQFSAGGSTLPSGKYFIRVLDNTELKVMEIRSADGATSAFFDVEPTEANSAPANSELVFNKYGDRYFLADLFDEGDPSGSEVVKSRDEKAASREAAEAVQHVPAHHPEQQGN